MAQRVGILGLGSIGLRHAKSIIALGHSVFGFDPDERSQCRLWDLGGSIVPREDALACEKLVIASPTPCHLQDLQDARCPTLVEKPIADQPICCNLNHVHMVGYNLRFHPCVRQAKAWIDAGFIGRLLCGHFILAQFNDKPAYLRDGVVLNWSHEIDLALHLLHTGDLLASVNKKNTVADLFIEHQHGAVSTIHLNYVNKKEVREFTILGDAGKIHCVLAPYRSATCEASDAAVYSYTYDTTFADDYQKEMQAFLSGEYGPGCTAQEACNVLNICLGGL